MATSETEPVTLPTEFQNCIRKGRRNACTDNDAKYCICQASSHGETPSVESINDLCLIHGKGKTETPSGETEKS